jgi:hypothetical protein
MTGRKGVKAMTLPHIKVQEILKKYNRLKKEVG